MTLHEIVAEWLREHGYDGLCRDTCGCGLDDLMPCGEPGDDCVPAYKRRCDAPCPDSGDCEMQEGYVRECWHPEKLEAPDER